MSPADLDALNAVVRALAQFHREPRPMIYDFKPQLEAAREALTRLRASTQPATVPAYQPMTEEERLAMFYRHQNKHPKADMVSFLQGIEAAESAVLARVAAAPAAAPVAWRVRGYAAFKTGEPGPWRYVDGPARPKVNNPECCDFEPLCGAAAPAAAPAGFKLLSRQPTEEMLLAVRRDTPSIASWTEKWAAMWDAAPAAVQPAMCMTCMLPAKGGCDYVECGGRAAVPSAVLAWRDAFAAYLAASERYNTRLAAIRAREAQFPNEFGRDNPEAEWHAMNAAEKLHRSLIAPMYGALTAAAPAAAPVTQDEREACAKWLVSYWRQKGFGERLTDAEMMAGHERSGQLEVASAAWSAAIRAAAPAAVQQEPPTQADLNAERIMGITPAAVQPVAQDERVDALMNLVGEWFYAAQNDPAGVGKTNYLNWHSKEAVAVHEAAQRLATKSDTERDAARYRWLRNPTTDVALVLDKVVGETPYDEQFDTGGYKRYEYRAGDELDAAIDAAMNAQPAGEQSNG